MERRYLSGNAKRKLKQVKESKEVSLLQKIPKLSDYFKEREKEETHSNCRKETINAFDASSTTDFGHQSSDDLENESSQIVGADSLCRSELDVVCDIATETANSSSREVSSSCDVVLEENSCNIPSNDPAHWPRNIDDNFRKFWISKGSCACQNREVSRKYHASLRVIGEKTRMLSEELFYCRLPNGESVVRDWLLYSPSVENVYYFACKLFSSKANSFIEGFRRGHSDLYMLEETNIYAHGNKSLTL